MANTLYTGNALLVYTSIVLAIPALLILLYPRSRSSLYEYSVAIGIVITACSSTVYHSIGSDKALNFDLFVRNTFAPLFCLLAILVEANFVPLLFSIVAIVGHILNKQNKTKKSKCLHHAIFVHLPVLCGFMSFV